ncbi:MAG: hypothetical protein ABWX90_04280 [Candidatus Saccharimonadales bacterium]
MNHERGNYEHLPTADYLFHQAGEAAVLTGRIEEIDNEYEKLRQFIIDDFSEDVKKAYPELRQVIYTPSYMIEGSPSGNMVSITLSDHVVRRDFMINEHDDSYDIDVEYSAADEGVALRVADSEMVATKAAIDYLFNDGALDDQNGMDQVEKIDFLLTQDHSVAPADIMMLGQLINTLSTRAKNK